MIIIQQQQYYHNQYELQHRHYHHISITIIILITLGIVTTTKVTIVITFITKNDLISRDLPAALTSPRRHSNTPAWRNLPLFTWLIPCANSVSATTAIGGGSQASSATVG